MLEGTTAHKHLQGLGLALLHTRTCVTIKRRELQTHTELDTRPENQQLVHSTRLYLHALVNLFHLHQVAFDLLHLSHFLLDLGAHICFVAFHGTTGEETTRHKKDDGRSKSMNKKQEG